MRTNLLKLIVFTVVIIVSMGFTLQQQEAKPRKFVVVLDAGHGGKDPGKIAYGMNEKDIALKIVMKAGAVLEKMEGVEVIYTRKKDEFITLNGRAQIANDAKADLFVSVHCNAHSSQALGTETFVLGLHRSEDNLKVAMKENSVIYYEEDFETTYGGFNPNSPESYIGFTLMQEEYLEQSILLADFIQKNFANKLKRTDRGVKQAGFLVLRQTYMPSVLIETGFLTNKSEGAFLNSEKGQNEIAQAVVEGILNYKNSINLQGFEDVLKQAPVEATTTLEENYTDSYKGVEFKVQVAATSKRVEPTAANFKGLNPIEVRKEGKLHKYYYGNTSSYKMAQKLQENAKKNGFSSCFLVAFKDGKKVSVNEALKSKVN